jgi:hypothetical protein
VAQCYYYLGELFDWCHLLVAVCHFLAPNDYSDGTNDYVQNFGVGAGTVGDQFGVQRLFP